MKENKLIYRGKNTRGKRRQRKGAKHKRKGISPCPSPPPYTTITSINQHNQIYFSCFVHFFSLQQSENRKNRINRRISPFKAELRKIEEYITIGEHS